MKMGQKVLKNMMDQREAKCFKKTLINWDKIDLRRKRNQESGVLNCLFVKQSGMLWFTPTAKIMSGKGSASSI